MLYVPKAEGTDDRLVKHFRLVREARRPVAPFRVQLRASSFPICPRKYHIYRRLPAAKRPMEEDSLMRESATLEGTALHMVLQRWFGIMLPHHAYGNWGCFKCRKLVKYALGLQKCPGCGSEMVYVEFEVRKTPQVPFTGHIDMVLKYYDKTYLVDFKGAYQRKIARIQNEGVQPGHYFQTNGYANAINLGGQDVGDLRIDKIVIIYVDRGAPWVTWLPFVLPVSQKAYRESVALINQAERSIETMQVPLGTCSAPDDYTARYCEAADLCFSPVLDTLLHDQVYPTDDTPQADVEGLLRARATRSDEGAEV